VQPSKADNTLDPMNSWTLASMMRASASPVDRDPEIIIVGDADRMTPAVLASLSEMKSGFSACLRRYPALVCCSSEGKVHAYVAGDACRGLVSLECAHLGSWSGDGL
jgi:hypothetical protein